MRKSRGFSLVELVVALGIVGLLAAIAVNYMRSTVSGTYDEMAKRAVEVAASAQLTYYDSRGEFATTPETLAALGSGDTQYITGPSTGPDVISVADMTDGNGTKVGVAALGSAGRCTIVVVDQNWDGNPPSVADVSNGIACTPTLATP